MAEEKKRMGRPVQFTEPRKRLTLEFPKELVDLMEESARSNSKNLREVFEAAARLWLRMADGVRE